MNHASRDAGSVATLTAKTMNAGAPWTPETN